MEQLKGPWRAVPSGLSRSGLPEYQIHWSSKGECVAEIVHGGEAARLIAAAPELLEACERAEKLVDAILSFYGQGLAVIHWHKNGDEEPLDNFIDDNSDGGELDALRAAIAKAQPPEE